MEEGGRGRALSMEVKPLRRPSRELYRLPSKILLLVVRIAHVRWGDDKHLDSLIEECKSLCVVRESLSILCNQSYEYSLTHPKCLRNMLILWSKVSHLEAGEEKFRSMLFSFAQKEFEGREQARKDNPQRVANAMNTLGGILHSIRLPGGEIYKFLTKPYIEYLKMVVSDSPDDIEEREVELIMVGIQVCQNGKALRDNDVDNLHELSTTLRCALAEEFTSTISRQWLLLLVELSNHDWSLLNLPKIWADFYSDMFGEWLFNTLVKNPTGW